MSLPQDLKQRFVPRGDVVTLLGAGIIIAAILPERYEIQVPALVLGAAIGLLFRNVGRQP